MDIRLTYLPRLFSQGQVSQEEIAAIPAEQQRLVQGLTGDPTRMDAYLEEVIAAFLLPQAQLSAHLQSIFEYAVDADIDFFNNFFFKIEHNRDGALYLCALLLCLEAFQRDQQFQTQEIINLLGRNWNFSYSEAVAYYSRLVREQIPRISAAILVDNNSNIFAGMMPNYLGAPEIAIAPIISYLQNFRPDLPVSTQDQNYATFISRSSAIVYSQQIYGQDPTNANREYYNQFAIMYLETIRQIAGEQFVTEQLLPDVQDYFSSLREANRRNLLLRVNSFSSVTLR